MLGIHLILMRIWIQDPGSPLEKIDPNPGHSLRFTEFFLTKQNFDIFCLIFSLIFMLKLDEPFKKLEIFTISDLGFETKSVFFAVLVDILHFGSGSVDPHISVDSDLYLGSQNLVDPMDSDP